MPGVEAFFLRILFFFEAASSSVLSESASESEVPLSALAFFVSFFAVFFTGASSSLEDESLLEESCCFCFTCAGFLAGGLPVSLSELLLSLELDSWIRFKASVDIFGDLAGICFVFAGVFCSSSSESLQQIETRLGQNLQLSF